MCRCRCGEGGVNQDKLPLELSALVIVGDVRLHAVKEELDRLPNEIDVVRVHYQVSELFVLDGHREGFVRAQPGHQLRTIRHATALYYHVTGVHGGPRLAWRWSCQSGVRGGSRRRQRKVGEREVEVKVNFQLHE